MFIFQLVEEIAAFLHIVDVYVECRNFSFVFMLMRWYSTTFSFLKS